MDFDLAAKRLQREQQQQRNKKLSNNNNRNSRGIATSSTNTGTSSRIQQQIVLQKQQQERIKQQQIYKQRYIQLLSTYRNYWNIQYLHIQSLLPISQQDQVLSPLTTSSLSSIPPSLQQQPKSTKHLYLQATSIYGEGDKITLPPSILETLLSIQQENHHHQQQQQQPWTFRIGIRRDHNTNENQKDESLLPLSSSMMTTTAATRTNNSSHHQLSVSTMLHTYIEQQLQLQQQQQETMNLNDPDDADDDDDDDDDDMDIDDGDDDSNRQRYRKKSKKWITDNSTPYLQDLQHHQYMSYTHGTVIEFTQDEGYIGIPKSIADTLLLALKVDNHDNDNKDIVSIQRTRTIDPSIQHHTTTNEKGDHQSSSNRDNNDNINKEDDTQQREQQQEEDQIEQNMTPGHVAYNAFDIPAVPLEISLIQLPKGKSMTLRPVEVIDNKNNTNSFYSLQQDQIKYLLEQSIVRTRATITLQDILSTWYRGIQYNFVVTQIQPSYYNAISCINTDIEIEFEPMSSSLPIIDDTKDEASTGIKETTTSTLSGGGRRLMDSTTTTTSTVSIPKVDPSAVVPSVVLPPEPPINLKENIITIQFRYNRSIGTTTNDDSNNNHNNTSKVPAVQLQRRFDITSTTIQDLFHYIRISTQQENHSSHNIQLIQRYPRRVYQYYDTKTSGMTLQQAGFQMGNELLIVEDI